MKTVRDLMERLQKLIDEDASWLDAEVAASHSVSKGAETWTAEMWFLNELEQQPNSNCYDHTPTVWLIFSEGDFSEFM